MNDSAEALIEKYSGLDDEEQAKFDKRYKQLLKFRKQLNAMADAINKATPEQLERMAASLKSQNH